MNCFRQFLKESGDSSIDYQSFIIHQDFEKIWNLFIDLKKINQIAPLTGENFENSGNIEEVGTFWKFNTFQNKNEINYMKVKYVNKNKKRNNWKFIVETFGTHSNIINQEIEVKVTKMFGGSCQVSIIHTFRQKVTEKFLSLFKKNKNLLLKKIKYLLEKGEK